MKKLLAKPFFLALFLLAIYCFSLMFGSLSVCTYTIYFQQKDILLTVARNAALEFHDDQERTFDQLITSDMLMLIYDPDGNRLRYLTPNVALPGTDRVSVEKHLPSVLAGKEVYRSVFLLNRTDIIVITGVPIREENTITGALFLIRNLKNLPEAIFGFSIYFTIFYWLSVYFIVSNIRKNQKLDKLRQTYIANVTHALKTPVASIKALSETLCDGVEPDPDQQRVYYGMILREANRQDHMIRDILELSKLQSQGMDFTKARIPAADVFGPVLEKYGTLADCMDVSLHISDTISRLPPLCTNAACIRQVLEILLDNALKFVSEGGSIWVEAVASGRAATICIRDNGIGIAQDALPHVFERFYKYSHDFNASGSGLGLAIAKEIIAGLKEKIWVESEAGKGAAFYFTVRLK